MPMNAFHRHYCASAGWARRVADELLPWVLDGVGLGDDVLEIGPGLGVTTRLLTQRVPRLTALEVDERFVTRLSQEFADRAGAVQIVSGDGATMPFPDGRFSAAVCFTMLHHVPSADAQDRLFAEAHRVLRPGGVFAGSDSQPSLRFRLIHLFDTMVVIDPATLPRRLSAAGFTDVEVELRRSVRFKAYKA
jgi:SAM-dependent methyltransferase